MYKLAMIPETWDSDGFMIFIQSTAVFADVSLLYCSDTMYLSGKQINYSLQDRSIRRLKNIIVVNFYKKLVLENMCI